MECEFKFIQQSRGMCKSSHRSLEPSKEVSAPINKKIYQNIIFLYFSRLISSKYFLIKDIKQLMAGAGVAVVGMVLVPLLSGLFSV